MSRSPVPATIATLLAEARRQLAASGIEAAGLEARLLVGHTLQLQTAALIAHDDQPVAAEECEAIHALIQARLAGQPIAYLIGQREFWSLPLQVDQRVLIPRPDTELLVECALHRIPSGPARVIDLGTGSGAVILALKTERPALEAFANDHQADALAVAAANAQRLALPIHAFRGHWLLAIAPRPLFDAIVSNPPYIDAADPHLDQGDLQFEPRTALVAPQQGRADLELIIRQSRPRLRPGGWLLLEHGFDQGSAVRALLHEHGFIAIGSHRDPGGHERVTEGQAPG